VLESNFHNIKTQGKSNPALVVKNWVTKDVLLTETGAATPFSQNFTKK
jgi:hypothetical protein